MRNFIKIALFVAAASMAVSCNGGKKKAAEADGAAAKDSTESVSGLAFDPAQLPEEPIFEIKTNMGTITVKLYSDTPKHRDNFVKLASERFYDGILFHRVIKGFMIQTGDPLTKDIANKARFGTGGPEDGHEIPAEIVPGHSHIKGALAAARKGDQANPMKNSSGSQFYIVENPDACKHLDGQYTCLQASRRAIHRLRRDCRRFRCDRPYRRRADRRQRLPCRKHSDHQYHAALLVMP